MNPLTQCKNATILPVLITLTLAFFGLSPQARATCQDACLTNSNTVQGDDALISLTSGYDNTAIGFNALFSNTTGFSNTANGFEALFNNTTGTDNTANGVEALFFSTTGVANTATGAFALNANTTGSYNTASGAFTLNSNTTGINNTATGVLALTGNRSGGGNTAIGYDALCCNTNGNFNTAIGYGALSPTNGSGNIAIVFRAGTNNATGDHNIYIGSEGTASESNSIRIGQQRTQTTTFMAGISGATVTGTAVVVNSSGQLGVALSSQRFKDKIRPMDKASEAILALKPVTFRYKKELDPKAIPQFGLVAEDVEKVNPDLVVRDEQGKPYTVRYEAVNAMLLNEFLKEHREVQEQKATIVELRSAMAQQQKDFQATAAHQQKQIEALTAGLQKVSAQLEAIKSVPQVVLNTQ